MEGPQDPGRTASSVELATITTFGHEIISDLKEALRRRPKDSTAPYLEFENRERVLNHYLAFANALHRSGYSPTTFMPVWGDLAQTFLEVAHCAFKEKDQKGYADWYFSKDIQEALEGKEANYRWFYFFIDRLSILMTKDADRYPFLNFNTKFDTFRKATTNRFLLHDSYVRAVKDRGNPITRQELSQKALSDLFPFITCLPFPGDLTPEEIVCFSTPREDCRLFLRGMAFDTTVADGAKLPPSLFDMHDQQHLAVMLSFLRSDYLWWRLKRDQHTFTAPPIEVLWERLRMGRQLYLETVPAVIALARKQSDPQLRKMYWFFGLMLFHENIASLNNRLPTQKTHNLSYQPSGIFGKTRSLFTDPGYYLPLLTDDLKELAHQENDDQFVEVYHAYISSFLKAFGDENPELVKRIEKWADLDAWLKSMNLKNTILTTGAFFKYSTVDQYRPEHLYFRPSEAPAYPWNDLGQENSFEMYCFGGDPLYTGENVPPSRTYTSVHNKKTFTYEAIDVINGGNIVDAMECAFLAPLDLEEQLSYAIPTKLKDVRWLAPILNGDWAEKTDHVMRSAFLNDIKTFIATFNPNIDLVSALMEALGKAKRNERTRLMNCALKLFKELKDLDADKIEKLTKLLTLVKLRNRDEFTNFLVAFLAKSSQKWPVIDVLITTLEKIEREKRTSVMGLAGGFKPFSRWVSQELRGTWSWRTLNDSTCLRSEQGLRAPESLAYMTFRDWFTKEFTQTPSLATPEMLDLFTRTAFKVKQHFLSHDVEEDRVNIRVLGIMRNMAQAGEECREALTLIDGAKTLQIPNLQTFDQWADPTIVKSALRATRTLIPHYHPNSDGLKTVSLVTHWGPDREKTATYLKWLIPQPDLWTCDLICALDWDLRSWHFNPLITQEVVWCVQNFTFNPKKSDWEIYGKALTMMWDLGPDRLEITKAASDALPNSHVDSLAKLRDSLNLAKGKLTTTSPQNYGG